MGRAPGFAVGIVTWDILRIGLSNNASKIGRVQKRPHCNSIYVLTTAKSTWLQIQRRIPRISSLRDPNGIWFGDCRDCAGQADQGSNGKARLLPSWRRNGSAGASPSRSMNWLGKVNVKMFTGVASPSRYKHCCGLPCRDSTSEGPRSSTIAATGILPSEVAMHKIAFAAGNRPLRRLSVSKFDFLVHDAWPLALGEFYSSYWSWQSRERNIRPYYPHLRHIEIRFR